MERSANDHAEGDEGVASGMNQEPIDIAEQVCALSDALGLRYHDVAELRITPSAVEATIYLPNENGKKHINISGWPVMSQRSFKVRT